METSIHLSPSPTDLIDWLNGEGLVDLDWDFPEDGDLVEAGLNASVVARLVMAVEDTYAVELETADLTPANLATPLTLATLISSKRK